MSPPHVQLEPDGAPAGAHHLDIRHRGLPRYAGVRGVELVAVVVFSVPADLVRVGVLLGIAVVAVQVVVHHAGGRGARLDAGEEVGAVAVAVAVLPEEARIHRLLVHIPIAVVVALVAHLVGARVALGGVVVAVPADRHVPLRHLVETRLHGVIVISEAVAISIGEEGAGGAVGVLGGPTTLAGGTDRQCSEQRKRNEPHRRLHVFRPPRPARARHLSGCTGSRYARHRTGWVLDRSARLSPERQLGAPPRSTPLRGYAG